jgi:hypothetical protein
MSTSADATALEVSSKVVHVAPGVDITIRFKDFYIIRAGACDFTGQHCDREARWRDIGVQDDDAAHSPSSSLSSSLTSCHR